MANWLPLHLRVHFSKCFALLSNFLRSFSAFLSSLVIAGMDVAIPCLFMASRRFSIAAAKPMTGASGIAGSGSNFALPFGFGGAALNSGTVTSGLSAAGGTPMRSAKVFGTNLLVDTGAQGSQRANPAIL